MNKYACLIILAVTSIITASCKKQITTDSKNSEIAMADIKAAFERESSGNDSSFNALRPSRYYNKPEWENAVWRKDSKGTSYLKVPLGAEGKITRFVKTVNGITGKVTEIQLPRPWLMAFKDSTGKISISVVQFLPARSLEPVNPGSKAGRISSNEVRLYSWSGELKYGAVLEHNTIIKRITSAKRNNNGNATARWEYGCYTQYNCVFMASCAKVDANGVQIMQVACQVQTVAGDGCSGAYPTVSPYTQMISGNLGLNGYQCADNWTFNNSEELFFCDYYWVEGDEPFPVEEPQPYEPDLPSLNYGVQSIINNLSNDCHRGVANDLMDYRLPSEIVKKAHDIYGVSAKLNLRFEDRSKYYINNPGATWPSNVAAAAQRSSYSNGIINSTIYLNEDLLVNASKEYIAATLLHEILHTLIEDSEDADHEAMASQYLSEMDILMADMYALSSTDAHALNVDGLRNTVLGSVLYNIFPSQWNSIVATATEYRNGTKGTICD